MPPMEAVKIRDAMSKNIGIPYEDVVDMDWSEIDQQIEQNNGKRLVFDDCRDPRRPRRGLVFLFLQRLLMPETMQNRWDAMESLAGK